MKSSAKTFSAAARLQSLVDGGKLAGAVALLATKDRIISLEAVGFADIAAAKPMTTDAFFRIASQTKPMTCTALMMLVDEGKVNVDDPVEKYLPEFKGQMLVVEKDDEHVLLRKPSHPIMVREILSHTSGLPPRSPLENLRRDLLPLHIAVRGYAMSPLSFEPGSQFEYGNAGTNTAGRIVEVVSGMPYAGFMQARLFDPLGMKDTAFLPNEEQVSRLAKTYTPRPDHTGIEEIAIPQLTFPLTNPLRQPLPGSGLFSTARDLARFCQMILNGGELDGCRYLSEASLKEMTRKQTGHAIEKEYGFGWDTVNGGFGHDGAHATHMSIDPARGLVMVFLLQHEWFQGLQAREVFTSAVQSGTMRVDGEEGDVGGPRRSAHVFFE